MQPSFQKITLMTSAPQLKKAKSHEGKLFFLNYVLCSLLKCANFYNFNITSEVSSSSKTIISHREKVLRIALAVLKYNVNFWITTVIHNRIITQTRIVGVSFRWWCPHPLLSLCVLANQYFSYVHLWKRTRALSVGIAF